MGTNNHLGSSQRACCLLGCKLPAELVALDWESLLSQDGGEGLQYGEEPREERVTRQVITWEKPFKISLNKCNLGGYALGRSVEYTSQSCPT